MNDNEIAAIRRTNARLAAYLDNGPNNECGGVPSHENLAQFLHRLHELPTQEELEAIYTREVMRRCGNHQGKAAAMMGISPQALCTRLKKYPK